MKKIIFLFVSIAIVALVAAWYHDTSRRSDAMTQLTYTPVEATQGIENPVINALAVQTDPRLPISQNSIENGQDALLLLFHGESKNKINLGFIQSSKMFFNFHRRRSNLIDPADPIFADLALFHIKGPQLITPLSKAGVLTIQLDDNALARVNANQDDSVGDTIGQLVMSDGTLQPIRVVKIDKNALNQALNPPS